MAFSSSEGKELFRDWLVHLAKPLGFTRFLDIGCGAGWYGKIIREIFARSAVVHGVEPFQEYIFRYNLGQKYDRIYCHDIREMLGEVQDYDLIIMGDILEHLPRQDAIDVVSALVQRCRFLWGALPVKMGRPWSTGYLQGPIDYEENPMNRHLWDWTGEEIWKEFKPVWFIPYIQTGTFLVEGSIQ